MLALPAVIALVLCLVPLAAAGGSGYDLSFTQAANAGVNADVDIVSVSTSYPSGTNLTVTTTVAGTFQTTNGDYFYDWYFGGGGEFNSTAVVEFTNNSTSATFSGGSSGGGSFGTLPIQASGGTLTFSVATALVGPSSIFTVNAYGDYRELHRVRGVQLQLPRERLQQRRPAPRWERATPTAAAAPAAAPRAASSRSASCSCSRSSSSRSSSSSSSS